jgi:acetoacetyl-CoA synthetase
MTEEILYTPRPIEIEQSHLRSFQRRIEEKYQLSFQNYQQLHQWSVDHSETFWTELIGFQGLIVEGETRPAVLDKTFKSYQWFPRLRLNLAENLLSPRSDETPVVVSIRECGHERVLTYKELMDQTQAMAQYLSQYIEVGDCVAALMPNTQETLIVMLATTALGGVFTSTSSDFGVEGVLDRFGQSKPKVLVTALATEYNGKRFCHRQKIKKIEQSLSSLKQLITVDLFDEDQDFEGAQDFCRNCQSLKLKGLLRSSACPLRLLPILCTLQERRGNQNASSTRWGELFFSMLKSTLFIPISVTPIR